MAKSHRRSGGGGSLLFSCSGRSGQALIESCLIVTLVCLIFFGIFQISQLFASQEILDYAAARGARARTVGFNHFMVEKTVLVGAIPNVGRMIHPAYDGGPARAHALEGPRIPLFLGAENHGQLRAILNYTLWDTPNTVRTGVHFSNDDGTLHETVKQLVPLVFPFHRAYYNDDNVAMSGTYTLDEHYPLYLDDQGW